MCGKIIFYNSSEAAFHTVSVTLVKFAFHKINNAVEMINHITFGDKDASYVLLFVFYQVDLSSLLSRFLCQSSSNLKIISVICFGV